MNLRTLDISSGVRPFWILTILCALLYLPGITSLPPIDRDEARFMQSTKKMIESGDYGRIRFQAELRDKKPIGAHWLQAATVKLLSADKLAQPWPLDAGFDEVLRFAAAGLSQDFLPKMIGGVESHDAPPGTHLTAAALTLWRWSWAAPIAAILAWK